MTSSSGGSIRAGPPPCGRLSPRGIAEEDATPLASLREAILEEPW